MRIPDMAGKKLKTRGKGNGSIYQRGDAGKWCASITLPDGKRRTFYGATRDEVKD
jgi:integrase